MIAQKKMNFASTVVLAAGLACLGLPSAVAQNTAPADANRPVRVRAKLDGFDLTPKATATPPRRPNQIGGASRGLGDVALFAPTMGKTYTLTPTFYWRSDDPQGEYTFRLSQPAMGDAALYEKKVVGDHFTYPADAPALKPGETYVWTVQPTVDMMGGPVSASVVVVGGTERDAVAAALAKSSDPAAQAKVYTDMRLWFDAVAAYSNLIAQNPARSDFYQARADLYDQVPATAALADADAAKVHK